MRQLDKQLDSEIQKRRDELQALETARAVLGGSPKATPRRRSGGLTRAPRGARKEQVLATLTEEPQGPSAIAKSVGMSPQHVTRVLKQVQAEGGAKRRTKGWVRA